MEVLGILCPFLLSLMSAGGEDRAGISSVHLSDPVGKQAGACFGAALVLGCVLSVSGSELSLSSAGLRRQGPNLA